MFLLFFFFITNPFVLHFLYSLDGSFYNAHSSMQFELAQEMLDILNIQGNERILDVGCGDGKVTYKIFNKLQSGSIKGIDQSTSMIHFAKSNFSEERVDFECINIENFDEKEEYDLIISFSSMHWFRNPELAFKNMEKAVKPNGKIFILSYPFESPDWDYYQSALTCNPKWHHFHEKSAYKKILSIAGYKNLINPSSLKPLIFEVSERFSCHSNVEEFKNYVKAWSGCFIKLPQEDLNEYIENVVKFGKNQFIEKSDKIFVPYKLIKIVLEKNKE